MLSPPLPPPTLQVDRLKAVIGFHLSGLVREVFDGKKPYNPVLGETCAWAWQHSDPRCGVTRMVCEQGVCLCKVMFLRDASNNLFVGFAERILHFGLVRMVIYVIYFLGVCIYASLRQIFEKRSSRLYDDFRADFLRIDHSVAPSSHFCIFHTQPR